MQAHQVIQLPFDEAIVEKTIQNALQKLPHTHARLMYARPAIEVYDNLVMGDMAKNALLVYLRRHCHKPIIDYDEIRTDDFKNVDPGWDFQFGKRGIRVEVKSSIPTRGETPEAIIRQRDIKITASHDKGKTWIPVEAITSEIHVQVYFYATTYRRGYDQLSDLEAAIRADKSAARSIIKVEKYHQPLFFGWEGKRQILRYAATLQPNTWTFPWTNRIYWRCPIAQARSLPELMEIIDREP
ncbi:MAG: hypothetical protein ACFCUI_03205 [Bernardetiaceae bacterium]